MFRGGKSNSAKIRGTVKLPVENSHPVNHDNRTPILKAPQPKASSILAQELKQAL